MSDLSAAHRAALAQIIEHCPDPTLAKLSTAVASLPGDRAMALAKMLAEETTDRKRRARVFDVLKPMFAARPDGLQAIRLPARVLPRLWKLAAAREPALLIHLDDDPLRGEPRDAAAAQAVADRVRIAGAAIVRDQPETIWPLGLDDTAERETGLAELAGCLDLSPLASRALALLPAWTGRPSEDQLAELRLLVRDASAVAPDGAQRLLEILFAHLDQAPLILRLVVHASSAAGRELFLFESELAVFVTRLIQGIDDRVKAIARYRPVGAVDPFLAVRRDIDWCASVLTELDLTIQMHPGGVWGKQVRDARARIGTALGRLLAGADKALEKALPSEKTQGIGRRLARTLPALTEPAPQAAIDEAMAALALIRAVRGSAQTFGCESQRHQALTQAIERLTLYSAQALDIIHHGDAPDMTTALAIVRRAAEFLDMLEATDDARTVRRRVAVVERDGPTPSPVVA